MPLTKEQIETLFTFTKKKFVPYYDLQMELVDHLASSIEDEIEKDTTLSFEAALQKVYSRFGLFGFAHVVQQRVRALQKKGRKLLWKTIKFYFSVPKIAFTILLFAGAYLLAPFLPGFIQRLILAATLLCINFTVIKIIRQQRKKDVKPLLMVLSVNYLIPLHWWTIFIYPYVFHLDKPPINPMVFASMVSAIIVYNLAAIQIYEQVRQQAKGLYPEAFSSG